MRCGWLNVLLACCRLFRRCRLCGCSAGSAVVAHVVDGRIVVDHCFVVNVGDRGVVHIRHGTVVVKRAVVPIPAFKSAAAIAKAVIHSAVKSNMRSPISAVPNIYAAAPTPISRRPQKSRRWCYYPGTWYPIVIVITVRPIPGRPDVSRSRADRLHINRQSRRANVHRNTNANLRGGSCWQCKKHCRCR